jgi:hypothetical protein
MPSISSLPKEYLRTLVATVLLALGAIAAVNAFMDPLWCFGTEHANNRLKLGFDERQQKLNVLTYRPAPYDAVLLGSSRVTFLDARDFHGHRAFNFAASEMGPEDEAAYLAYAAERLGPQLRTVFVGLDFEGTNAFMTHHPKYQSARRHLENVRDPLYRLKLLLSWDAFNRSLEGWSINHDDGPNLDLYDAQRVKHPRRTDEALMLRRTNQNLNVFSRRYRFAYRYDERYREQLRAIAGQLPPHAKLVPFSPPISAMFLEVIRREGRLEDYRRWIRDTVAVYGGVYHFCYRNSVTRDLNNFLDGQHQRPEVGGWMAGVMTERPMPGAPKDFGVYVTPSNVEAFLQMAIPAEPR